MKIETPYKNPKDGIKATQILNAILNVENANKHSIAAYLNISAASVKGVISQMRLAWPRGFGVVLVYEKSTGYKIKDYGVLNEAIIKNLIKNGY
ncbi:MAG: hypothetical protein RPS47_04775 [Colwellia sp.]|jgi:hypothetical protein